MSTDNINDAFTLLKMDFPVFTLVNKKAFPQHIAIRGGESVQINGNAEANVDSTQLIQLPDTSIFRYVSPTFEDLIKYGLIKSTATVSDPGDSGIATLTRTVEEPAPAADPVDPPVVTDPPPNDPPAKDGKRK